MTHTPLPAAFFLPVGAAQLPGGMSAGAFYSARDGQPTVSKLSRGVRALNPAPIPRAYFWAGYRGPACKPVALQRRGAHGGNLVTFSGKSENSGHRGRERGQPRAATIQHPAGSPRQSAGATNRKSGFDLVGNPTGAHQSALQPVRDRGDC